MRRCLECKRESNDLRRGLCRRCYRSPVRDDYPCLPRGAWIGVGRAWDVVEDAALVDLFNKDLSDRQIAKQLGRSEKVVARHRRRLGIVVSTSRQSRHREENRRRLA